MLDERKQDYLYQLSKTSFYKLKGIDIYPVMVAPMFMNEGKVEVRELYRLIKQAMFKNAYENKQKGCSKQVFLFTSSYRGRKDYALMMDRVVHVNENYIYLKSIEKKKNIEADGCQYLIYIIIWFIQMSKKNIPFMWRLFIVIHLYYSFIEVKCIERCLNNRDVKTLVTFCDVHSVDALATQYFKKNGFTTVTLQHGHFNSKDRGWVFSCSKSDFFLTHGEFANREAEKCGVSKERLVPVGMMNYISSDKECESNGRESHIFGVLLNGPGAADDNKGLLSLSNYFAKKYGYKYIIKSHPVLEISVYKNLIEDELLYGFAEKGISIAEFSKQVDFAFAGNSTVFMEFLFLEKMIFRYVGICQDIYEGIEEFRFMNKEDLDNIYSNCIKNPDMTIKNIIRVKDYLCQNGDIARNYREFFAMICQKDMGE